MPYTITLNTPIEANHEQLKGELDALAISGVRTYSIIGGERQCKGVYVWDDSAPAGEYQHHAGLSAANEQAVRDAIAAHVPDPEPDPDADLVAAITAATTLQELKNALLGSVKPARVKGKSV